MSWNYERLKEDGTVESISEFKNDTDGSITGRIVINVKAWFDENPEERIRRGWTKHISFSDEEIRELWPYNTQTQYLIKSTVQVDEYTIQDTYHAIDKSEEQLLLEEISESIYGSDGFIIFN